MKTKKTIQDFLIGDWIRECQECDNIQKDIQPIYGESLIASYEMRKCKYCKSEALDYGKEVTLSRLQEIIEE